MREIKIFIGLGKRNIGQGFDWTKNLIFLYLSPQKSDKLLKFALFRISKIGLFARLGIHTKKIPQKVLFKKWCRQQECKFPLVFTNGPLSCRKVQTSYKTKLVAKVLHSFSPTIHSGHCFASPFLVIIPLKYPAVMRGFLMVPPARIGLATPSLPMTCSTTELWRP